MVGMGDISPSMYTAGAETSIHSMMVNLRCQRFWSEQGYTNNFRGTRLTQQPDHQGFAIFDEKIRATFGEVDAAEAEFKADTIEGLAEACGLDPVLLARSVERYNQLCETGWIWNTESIPSFWMSFPNRRFRYAPRLRVDDPRAPYASTRTPSRETLWRGNPRPVRRRYQCRRSHGQAKPRQRLQHDVELLHRPPRRPP